MLRPYGARRFDPKGGDSVLVAALSSL